MSLRSPLAPARRAACAFVVSLAFLSLSAPAWAAPKLLVLVSIDQMRADYIETYGKAWKHGLRRLLRQGAQFENARYPYLNTVTCAGHTTIGTGAFSHKHGLILNGWWSRKLGRGFECTEDPAAPAVTYGEGNPSPTAPGHSAINMQVPTFADALKGVGANPPASGPKARVVSFSLKPRSAIGMVGGNADLVTWFDGRTWSTSKRFAETPDPLVAKMVEAHPTAQLLAKPWTKVGQPRDYRFADEDRFEHAPMPFWTSKFPHPLVVPPGTKNPDANGSLLSPLAAWQASPMTDVVLLDFAKGAIDKLALGRGKTTDMLAVSFSALDAVGHEFGPRSHEVQDVLLRLDRILDDLLRTLDKKVGKNNYLLALTADHGVATYPEQLVAEGKDAGRVSRTELGKRLDAALAAELGPGKYVTNLRYTDLYLADGVFDRLRAKPGAVDRVKAAVASVPGVAAVFATDELRDPSKIKDPLQHAVAMSHFPGRSGDFMVAPKPNWLTTSEGTTHGTQNDYDQHVPLLLFGAGIKAGRYRAAASPADIAPTFAAVVGVPLPTAEGRVLGEALKGQNRARRAPKASTRRP